MVDVLSTRLQEVYAKWETRTEVTRNEEPTTTRFSLDGNCPFSHSEALLFLRKMRGRGNIQLLSIDSYHRRATPTILSQRVSASTKYDTRI